MQALRTRAACAARAARTPTLRPSRSYASDHGHHAAPQVEESLGTAFYVFVAAVPLCFAGYTITRPGKDGEPSSMTKWLQTFDHFNESERRNTIRTNIVEQAAHDKHLFFYGERNRHVELKMPELLGNGSPYNVPAGHKARNMEQVTAYYQKQYEKEEERKLERLAAKAKAESESKSESS